MDVTGGRSGGTPRTVTARALAILESFSPERTAMSLVEISRCTGLSASTAHRLIGELSEWGALERLPDLRYRIGRRLCEVAALSPHRGGLLAGAMPFLEDLFDATGRTVQLVVLDGAEVVTVAQLCAGPPNPDGAGCHSRSPHSTAAGLVLLSFLPPAVRATVAAPTPPMRAVPRQSLDRVVAEVRAAGIALTNGQYEHGVVAIAAPVFDASNEVVAAISLRFPARGAYPISYVPAVRVAARGASRALGAERMPPSVLPGGAAQPPPDWGNGTAWEPPGQVWPGGRAPGGEATAPRPAGHCACSPTGTSSRSPADRSSRNS